MYLFFYSNSFSPMHFVKCFSCICWKICEIPLGCYHLTQCLPAIILYIREQVHQIPLPSQKSDNWLNLVTLNSSVFLMSKLIVSGRLHYPVERFNFLHFESQSSLLKKFLDWFVQKSCTEFVWYYLTLYR